MSILLLGQQIRSFVGLLLYAQLNLFPAIQKPHSKAKLLVGHSQLSGDELKWVSWLLPTPFKALEVSLSYHQREGQTPCLRSFPVGRAPKPPRTASLEQYKTSDIPYL